VKVDIEVEISNSGDHPDTRMFVSADPDGFNRTNFVYLIINGERYEFSAHDMLAAIVRATGEVSKP
jgi:hypothetical protein